MAWTANSFPMKIRAVSNMHNTAGGAPPFQLHGYLTVSVSHREGDVLARQTNGLLAKTTTDAATDNTLVMGVLAAIAPKVGDATQTPRQRTTNATAPNYIGYDNDKSAIFYPWITGNIFEGHFVTDAANDETLDADDNLYKTCSYFLTSNVFLFGKSSGATKDHGYTIGIVNPQVTTVLSSVLVTRPGPPVVGLGGGSTTGTKNPLMLVVPKLGPMLGLS